MFLGEYTHALDRESRLALPARLREAGGQQLARGLCLIPSPEPCIIAYTHERLEELLAALEADASLAGGSARDFKRALGSRATVAAPDRQGRVRLPPFLREHAGIDRDVTVVGAVDAIEIWCAATYRDREGARATAYDRLAPRVFR